MSKEFIKLILVKNECCGVFWGDWRGRKVNSEDARTAIFGCHIGGYMAVFFASVVWAIRAIQNKTEPHTGGVMKDAF